MRAANSNYVRKLYSLIGELTSRPLARTTSVVLFWNLARLISQFAWMILLARVLGPEGYGEFSGLAGLALAMSGLSGLGLGLRLYRDVVREPNLLSLRWAQTKMAIGWSGAALTLLFVTTGQQLFPLAGLLLLLMIAGSEVVLAPLVTQATFAYAALGNMAKAAAIPVALSSSRAIAALALWLLPLPSTLSMYAGIHLTVTGLAVVFIVRRCELDLESAPIRTSLAWTDIREGLSFSSIWASTLALGSLDKVSALHIGGAGITGQYTASQRFASLTTLPIDALITAIMPRLFKTGDEALGSHTVRLVGWLALSVGVYGLVAGLALWLGADLLTWALGQEFDEAAQALHLFSFWVPLYCLRILGSNVLLGFGWRRWRFVAEIFAVITTVLSMIILVPSHGLNGAIYALVSAEILLVILIWWRIIVGIRRKTDYQRCA
jgi:O-antigen/teichoic acid export membrane protein